MYSKNIDRIRNNTISRRRKHFTSGFIRTKTKCNTLDKDYGLAEPLYDMLSVNSDVYIEKREKFLNHLYKVNINEIEKITREQNHSEEWRNERKKRLTASRFGEICKMRENSKTLAVKSKYIIFYTNLP